MKNLLILALGVALLSSCAVQSVSIDSTAEAIDVYCQGFNYPMEDGAEELRLIAIKYLKHSSDEIAQGVASIFESALDRKSNGDALILVADMCSGRELK